MTHRRKLIEVALPLEAINREAAREKSIRHGHPSTLHLWWARRPLAAARAVLFAQLVDDPSAHPDRFPTEEAQKAERQRLFDLLERLVVWENTTDQKLLDAAHAEIVASCDGNPPPILDPFAGGGSIPLEAQRLGLEAHASDLNPVAVLINKALIEIPPTWAGQPPVFPGAAEERLGDWTGATGLAEDVRRYGAWMRDQAQQRIGHLYPKATLPDGTQANVIAWIWARTVTCPNPACGATMPLVSTLWLSKKKTRPTWLEPVIEGKHVRFDIATGPGGPQDPPKQGRGAKFACLACGDVPSDAYIKSEAVAGRMGAQLLATVAEGQRQRVYLPATPEHVAAAEVARPGDVPEEEMPTNPRWFSPPAFGLRTYADIFTHRQLVALTTFSDLVGEARDQVEQDARAAGLPADRAAPYATAVATYLALAFSRTADLNNAIVTWSNSRDQARNLFARQAIPMAWDFVEVNPFGDGAGDFGVSMASSQRVLPALSTWSTGSAHQADASQLLFPREVVVSTDPPYYDNIGYADLSDFFYVWLRRSLRDEYRELLGTLLTPKAEELVATPYRFGGDKAAAEMHFEDGFVRTFTRIREHHRSDIPVTIFYAFKQSEDDAEGTASTGWETLLEGLIQAGLAVTATWPMRTERAGRSIGIGTNALASSIVLACRPRESSAETVTRRGFLAALHTELPQALRELQQGSIAPVDLAQAAIGPGMAVFSRYAQVLEADGSPMRVRTALALINQVLDEVLSEQEGDFDSDTRWCVKWFTTHGFDPAAFGEADVLARATNTSVDGLARAGVVTSRAGKVALVAPDDLDAGYDPLTDHRITVWEVALHLAHRLSAQGGDAASGFMAAAGTRVDLDSVKELAYLLYSLCERKGWTKTAILFNGLGQSWSDLSHAARSVTPPAGQQSGFDFDASDD